MGRRRELTTEPCLGSLYTVCVLALVFLPGLPLSRSLHALLLPTLVSAKCHFFQEALPDHPSKGCPCVRLSHLVYHHMVLRVVPPLDIPLGIRLYLTTLLPALWCKLLEVRDSVLLTTICPASASMEQGLKRLCQVNDCI